jgi:DnaJ homolog subfamily C member 28
MSDDFEQHIDKILREAREKGAFQDLPGKGKPIRWEDDALVPEDQRLAHKILRDNGFTLDWIEMGQELERQYVTLRQRLDAQHAARTAGRLNEAGWQEAQSEFSRKVQELNKRIIEYNLRVPHEQFARRLYPTDPQANSGEMPGS